MPITVNHSTPADGTFSATGATAWDANHTLSGVGTMAEQNANAVAITGGTATLTSVTTPIVQATNSAGLALKNSGGTTQISMGAGGGDNVTVAVSTNLNGTNAQIDISPTGTGHVHIKPTGANSVEIAPTYVGEMDNITIGATTPSSVNATTITGQTGVLRGTGSNLLLYSEQLQQANWSTIATTVTANTQIAPDGTTTADTLVGSSGSSRIFQAISPFPTTSSTWTLSVYLKSASNVTARIGIGSAGIREILTQNVSVTTDWQRFSITATGLSTDTGNLQVSIYCSDGTSGNTIFAWGAQGERASSVGNYVLTTTTAVYGTPTLSFSGVSTI